MGMRVLLAEALEAANRALGVGDGWMLGTGCLQQCWCPGKHEITPWRHQGSLGGGVWRVVPMTGGSSTASHIHGAPRENCGSCQWCMVCGSQAAISRGSPAWAGAFLKQCLCCSWVGKGAWELDPGRNWEGDTALAVCIGSVRTQSLLLKAGLGYCSPFPGLWFPSQRGCHCIQTTAVVPSWPLRENPAWGAGSVSGPGSWISCKSSQERNSSP